MKDNKPLQVRKIQEYIIMNTATLMLDLRIIKNMWLCVPQVQLFKNWYLVKKLNYNPQKS